MHGLEHVFPNKQQMNDGCVIQAYAWTQRRAVSRFVGCYASDPGAVQPVLGMDKITQGV
jgi:hypothetical protein